MIQNGLRPSHLGGGLSARSACNEGIERRGWEHLGRDEGLVHRNHWRAIVFEEVEAGLLRVSIDQDFVTLESSQCLVLVEKNRDCYILGTSRSCCSVYRWPCHNYTGPSTTDDRRL